MPHIIVSDFVPPKTPFATDHCQFEFASSGTSGVVGAKIADNRFLIRWFAHKNGTIIKTDKSTRLASLQTMKTALFEFACPYRTVSSTLSVIRQADQYQNLKTPHFFTDEFAYDQEIWLEIGFGSGRHILQNAKDNQDVLHIGLEVHKPSAEQLLRRAISEKLDNIIVMLFDARVVLESIATASVKRIFVHFPVPWDDSPTKRVFSAKFLSEALRVLVQNGTLELRTDSKEYFDFANSLLAPDQEAIRRTNQQTHTSSKYEDRWKRLDKDIYDLIIQKNNSETFKRIWYDFGFKNTKFDLNSVVDNLKNLEIKEEFLLKLRESWQIDNGILIQIAMGNHQAPQTIYLLAKPDQVSYYPALPLQTKQNHLAHCAINEAIYGK